MNSWVGRILVVPSYNPPPPPKKQVASNVAPKRIEHVEQKVQQILRNQWDEEQLRRESMYEALGLRHGRRRLG